MARNISNTGGSMTIGGGSGKVILNSDRSTSISDRSTSNSDGSTSNSDRSVTNTGGSLTIGGGDGEVILNSDYIGGQVGLEAGSERIDVLLGYCRLKHSILQGGADGEEDPRKRSLRGILEEEMVKPHRTGHILAVLALWRCLDPK